MQPRHAFWQACSENLAGSWLKQDFAHLSLDSRTIQWGDVFIALPGQYHDGRAFIEAALAQGARAIVQPGATAAWQSIAGVLFVEVPQLSARLGELAALYYHHPSRQLQIHAITGTNGKTSCSHFLAQALTHLNYSAAVIGTLGCGVLGHLTPLLNTTPDAVTLQRCLADFVQAGISHVAIEASSIALVQGRLQGCQFASAVLTNLSRDHLDYHGDMEAYGRAKVLLFAWPDLKRVVLNDADVFSADCLAVIDPSVNVYRYSLGNESSPTNNTLCAQILANPSADWSQRALLTFAGEQALLVTALLGAFNLENLLSVAAILLDIGISLAIVAAVLSKVTAVPGRLETLRPLDQPTVVVDYAHTPAALEHLLLTIKPYAQAKLWCVFGCGGNRDRGKRAAMGAIAGRLADHTVLTDDNPRFEVAAAIIAEIEQGLPEGALYEIIADRAMAIAQVIALAKPGDVIVIAGKGHENTQQIGAIYYPFDDKGIAMACLKNRF